MLSKTLTTVLTAGFAVACLHACKKEPKTKSGAKSTPGEGMYEESLPPDDSPPRPVTRRAPQPLGPELAGSHILIAYKGSQRAKPEVTRTKEEAKKFAQQLSDQLKKNPKIFAELAKKHSNGPSGPRGGFLGSWNKGRMVPAFDNAISTMKIGEVSGVVETPFGFHVLIRMPLPPTYAGRHILIAYKGSQRARPNVTRSKEEALKFAKQLSAQLKKDPSKFVELAKQHSNGPSGPRGGSLGTWKKGRMVPEFDTAIEKLKIGEVSDTVETPFGYHVIKREDPKTMPTPRMQMPRRR